MSEEQSTDTIVISISELRLRTLEAIVDHCTAGLPVPSKVSTIVYSDTRCGLTLHFDTAEAVEAWAGLLGLTVRDNGIMTGKGHAPFRHYVAETHGGQLVTRYPALGARLDVTPALIPDLMAVRLGDVGRMLNPRYENAVWLDWNAVKAEAFLDVEAEATPATKPVPSDDPNPDTDCCGHSVEAHYPTGCGWLGGCNCQLDEADARLAVSA